MRELSIIIPSRKEEWLNETVKNILANIEADTEVIVGFDGEWSEVPLESHERVKMFYSPEVLGQRAMGNRLAKLSTAKYIAKTDAHCAFDKGFDRKLIEAMQGHDDWTIVPAMKNLHAYDWVCNSCGKKYYQSDRPDNCNDEVCVGDPPGWHKEVSFEPRTREKTGHGTPTATAYRFTPDELQFKYFDHYKAYQKDEVAETMSLQGSFFMLTRERYHALNINDESWGGWGQQGTEVALKTWLSGGAVMCHRGTWYAHMFRTNDIVGAFPWNVGIKESQGRQQRRARRACVDMFKNNAWELQTRPLSWLIEKFWEPLQKEGQAEGSDRTWNKKDLELMRLSEWRFHKPDGSTKGILYLTDNELPLKIAKNAQSRIRKIALNKSMELVSSSRKPMGNMGKNVVTRLPRGYECYFKQILAGLEAMESDLVFIAEHDVLYPPEHFDFTPPDDKIYYDVNWWKVHDDGVAVSWEAEQVSGICAPRKVLLEWYKERVKTFNKDDFDRKFEPLSGEGSQQWKAPVPHIDIRHGKNLTYNKKKLEHFRKVETAVNFQSITIDQIPNWELTLEDIY